MARVRQSRSTTVPRWAALLLGVVAVLLVPWALYLSYALPARHITDEWRLAWAGFDIGLAFALAATAVGIVRGTAWLEAAAAAAMTLLVTDAWFDIVLAQPGRDRLESVALAVLAELPLALFCLWIALNAERALSALRDRVQRPEPVPARRGGDGAQAGRPEARARPTRRA